MQTDAAGHVTTLYFAGARTEIVEPAGTARVSYFDPFGRTLATLDGLGSADINGGNGNLTRFAIDGQERVAAVTYPAGDGVATTYDAWSNPLTVTRTPVAGSGLAPVTTTFTYTAPVAGQPNFERVAGVTDGRGLVTAFAYDDRGNRIASVADAGGAGHFNARSTALYDDQGRLLRATSPLGVATAMTYDALGNLIKTVADDGADCSSSPTTHLCQSTQFAYDAMGNVTAVTDPGGHVTVRSSDGDRRLTSVTLPATGAGALVTTTAYDADGHVTSTAQSAGGQLLRTGSASYTPTGQLATATDANGNVTRYAYDANNRLASVSDAAGRVTVYGYDALSRPSTLSNPGLQANPLVTRTYTANGRPASLAIARSDSVADTTSFAYDGLDRLSVTTWPLGSTESLSYDAGNHVVRRVTRKGDAISFAYDTLNRVCTKTYAAAAVACGGTSADYLVSYGYDLAGRLIAVNDNSAAIARPLPPGGAGTVQYLQTASYDALNRPLNVGFGPAPAQTPPAAASSVTFGHAYDATNRRIGQTTSDTGWWAVPGAAATVAYSVNALNQYTAVGAVTPSYDGNGNLTFDGTFTYGYDAENRLVSATGAGLTASYAYDAAGHRKSRTVNGTTTLLIGDGSGPDLLEYDGASGQLRARILAGPGANEPVGRLDLVANTRTSFIPDIQGSVIASLDSATGALTRQGYRSFGESPGSAVFGYTGQRLDPETGLYDYHARAYLPAWGRFNQPDPIGYAGGNHLYAYVGNDPLNAVDPDGLCTEDRNGDKSRADQGSQNNKGYMQVAQAIDFKMHTLERMNQEGISPLQVLEAVNGAISITPQPNGSTEYVGANGIAVVIGPEDQIMTVYPVK